MEDMILEISKALNSMEYSIAILEKEQKITNALLRAMLKSRKGEYNLPKEYWRYTQRSFLMLCEKFNDAFEFSTKIAQRDGKKLFKFEDGKEGDFCACVTALNEGDYILIDNDLLLKMPELQHMVLDVYHDNTLSISIGAGPEAREIVFDTPNINFIIFTDIESLIPSTIKAVFPLINEDCRENNLT